MAKEFIRGIKFRAESVERVDLMNEIIEEYQDQDLKLTARQLYYQFVARGHIPNSQKEYKKLTCLLTDARYAGLVDWDAIEDRGREPSSPAEWHDLQSLTESALQAYRLPRWEGQDYYVELWVEKQALAGVLEPLAREFHVTLMVNKGYSSASAMKESSERIKRHTVEDPEDEIRILSHNLKESRHDFGKDSHHYQDMLLDAGKRFTELIPRKTVIFYLGDHDPSGEDMVRDIDDRLGEFGCLRMDVKKLALTMEQVKRYDPPPNPAKITDPRAKDYIAKYGDKSWEVDALPPDVLARLIRRGFESVIDKEMMDVIKKREEEDKHRLREAVASLETS